MPTSLGEGLAQVIVLIFPLATCQNLEAYLATRINVTFHKWGGPNMEFPFFAS